jgi:hypothetical protein
MDKLEEFIKGNKADLDKYEPSKSTWRGIRVGLKKRRTISPVWFSAVAAVVLILGISIIIMYLFQKKNSDFFSSNSGQPALKETEVYYKTQMNTLYLEAKPLLINQPVIARELKNDMAHLDSIRTDLKKDLKDNVANQEVIEAMIQNYRIKLQLLEDMLNLLKQNETKSEKTKSNEL